MKKHPKVKLIISPKGDANLGVDFVRNSLNGKIIGFLYKFLPYALHYTLDPKISDKKRSKLIRGYAKYMYADHKEVMVQGVKAAKSDWAKVEKRYFHIIDRIFKDRSWPKGEYVGYSTVWHSYPRNIKYKTFYFPYAHNLPQYSNSVVAHEMMHFMFFDYIEERYGLTQKSELPGKPKNYVWVVSEAFNNVMEDWVPYKRIFKHGPRIHQGVEEVFAKMKEQWKKNQDIDILLDKWLKA